MKRTIKHMTPTVIFSDKGFDIFDDIEYENVKIVIIKDNNALKHHQDAITAQLRSQKFKGQIIIDLLLHIGNGSRRFLSSEFDKYNLTRITHMDMPRNDFRRGYICNWLRDKNIDLTTTILTDTQISAIQKGTNI